MVKRNITIMESMTEKELDSTNIKIFSEPTRIARIAKGSGVHNCAVQGAVAAIGYAYIPGAACLMVGAASLVSSRA